MEERGQYDSWYTPHCPSGVPFQEVMNTMDSEAPRREVRPSSSASWWRSRGGRTRRDTCLQAAVLSSEGPVNGSGIQNSPKQNSLPKPGAC